MSYEKLTANQVCNNYGQTTHGNIPLSQVTIC